MRVGPDITDLAGNPLDQDGNGTAGEPTDIYDATFNLVDVDLQLSNLVISNPQLWAGDAVTVSWDGANTTGLQLLGDWSDAVYLSTDGAWDIADILLATVPHTGGLAAGLSYSQSVDVAMPGVMPGDYYVIIRADLYNQEKESGQEGNNVLPSAAIPLDVHELTAGTPITGNDVIDAITPGRCAAIPAPAIITFNPFVSAFFVNFSTSSGVRCADKAFISKEISISSKKAAAFFIP